MNDIAHTAEGSLAETSLHAHGDDIHVRVRCPAILVGTIGGGTVLPSQKAALSIFLHEKTALKPTQQLAEIVGAAVLAGEISLLAALSTQDLATAHKNLAR
jgi:hydroxymethylglutaryl-CoA reductase (NADPH)